MDAHSSAILQSFEVPVGVEAVDEDRNVLLARCTKPYYRYLIARGGSGGNPQNQFRCVTFSHSSQWPYQQVLKYNRPPTSENRESRPVTRLTAWFQGRSWGADQRVPPSEAAAECWAGRLPQRREVDADEGVCAEKKRQDCTLSIHNGRSSAVRLGTSGAKG